jgi:hypothetical protein
MTSPRLGSPARNSEVLEHHVELVEQNLIGETFTFELRVRRMKCLVDYDAEETVRQHRIGRLEVCQKSVSVLE